jgi:hypothetical protein
MVGLPLPYPVALMMPCPRHKYCGFLINGRWPGGFAFTLASESFASERLQLGPAHRFDLNSLVLSAKIGSWKSTGSNFGFTLCFGFSCHSFSQSSSDGTVTLASSYIAGSAFATARCS